MYALDPPDADFENVLDGLSLGESSRLIAVRSTLLKTGRAGRAVLAVNVEKLAVIEAAGDDSPPEIVLDVALKELTGIRVNTIHGGSRLIVDIDRIPRDVMRIPPGASGLLAAIAGKIDKYIDKPEPAFKPKSKADARKSETEKEAERKETARREAEEKDGKQKTLDFDAAIKKYNEAFKDKYKYILPDHPIISSERLSRRAIVWRVFGFAGKFKKWLILIIVLLMVSSLIGTLPPIITKIIIDEALTPIADPQTVPVYSHLLFWAVAGLFGVIVSGNLLSIISGRLNIWVGAEISHIIRLKTFRHLGILSLSYFNKHQTGALLSRVNSDTRMLQGFLVEGLQFTITSVLTLFYVVTILLVMDWRLGLLALLPIPLVLLISKLVWKSIFRRFRKLWESFARLSAFLSDSLSGIRVVKAFGQEHREMDKFDMFSRDNRDRTVNAEKTLMTLLPIMGLMLQSSLFLIWYFGGMHVIRNNSAHTTSDFTLGSLMAYIGLLGLLYRPLQILTRLNQWMTRSLTAAERIFEILDTEPLILNNPDAQPVEKIEGRVEFDNVTFGYEAHDPVLKNMSFEVKPGETIGLVGHSGAGKSTVMNLILRLFDVDEGRILLDGKDIREYRIEDLRDHVGVVLQDTFLFSGSIRDNLLYANPDASDEDMIQASMDANAHEFIMKKPDGYDTLIGERGAGLSGGEKQRISIARALLKNPKILVLDEATSSVDTETEAKIQAALQRLVEGRTTFAIAHRLSTLRHTDRLFVLEHGKIVESGTHEELMAKEGVYHKLVSIQTEWAKTIAVGG